MFIRKSSQKGYSLVMWIATFAVVVAVFMIIKSSLRKALRMKVQQTAAYVFWEGWGSNTNPVEPQVAPTETTTRERSSQAQAQSQAALETHGGNITTVSNITSQTKSASVSTEEGSQPIMDSIDLKTLNN